MVLVVHIPQAVDDHRVDQLRVAHAEAVTRAFQHVCRGAHVFLAAGDNHVGVAALDRLRREMNGLETAAAHLADRHGGHHVGEPALERSLACRVLTIAGSQHLAHDDLRYLLGFQPGFLQQRLDDFRTQLGGGNLGQRAAELADGGPGSCNDDNVVFHFQLSFKRRKKQNAETSLRLGLDVAPRGRVARAMFAVA